MADRLARLRREMQAQSIDCLALLPGPNLRYLTGVNSSLMERVYMLLLPLEGQPVAVLPLLEVDTFDQTSSVSALPFTWVDADGPSSAVARAAAALPPIKRLAVEDLRMRVQEYRLLHRYLPGAEIVPGESLMDALRLCKGPEEIQSLKKAVAVAEAALLEVVAGVKPGQTEDEVAANLSIALLKHGGESKIVLTVLSGPRSALPHGNPSGRVIEAGDPLLFDYCVSVDGYYADITRTYFVSGKPSPKSEEVYRVVQEANRVGRATARPGVTCAEVDAAVRAVITAAGYGEYFTHRTGHGLGLEIHEAPNISATSQVVLQPGMVFTIEPGVYLDGVVGIRVEDDVVITETGCESLSSLNRDIQVAGK